MATKGAYWKGRRVLITGSSRGIGRETARYLGTLGARVALNGRNRDRLEQTAGELENSGIEILAEAGDVSNRGDMDRLVNRVAETFGGLDVLINNAGVSMRGPFATISEELARRVTEVNLIGAAVATAAALPLLEESRGSVVFISSAAGLRGFPNVSIYSATKMALTGLADSLSAELRSTGVHVGVLYLGFTENDPDKEIFDSRGERIQVKRSWQHTQADAAEAIAEAIRRRRRRAVFTAPGRVLALAQRLSPALVDWAVSRVQVHRR
ncbi:MAG: SDR family oxidoreductase [Alkalispirochaetaceae bacterium]